MNNNPTDSTSVLPEGYTATNEYPFLRLNEVTPETTIQERPKITDLAQAIDVLMSTLRTNGISPEIQEELAAALNQVAQNKPKSDLYTNFPSALNEVNLHEGKDDYNNSEGNPSPIANISKTDSMPLDTQVAVPKSVEPVASVVLEASQIPEISLPGVDSLAQNVVLSDYWKERMRNGLDSIQDEFTIFQKEINKIKSTLDDIGSSDTPELKELIKQRQPKTIFTSGVSFEDLVDIFYGAYNPAVEELTRLSILIEDIDLSQVSIEGGDQFEALIQDLRDLMPTLQRLTIETAPFVMDSTLTVQDYQGRGDYEIDAKLRRDKEFLDVISIARNTLTYHIDQLDNAVFQLAQAKEEIISEARVQS